MSKHVFVSHSHKDSAVANSIVAALERRDIPCWIAPRDVTPGGSYAESILTAIESASCFVLIYSEHSNVSSHVLREVERALKFGVNIVPVRFDDSTPSKSLDYLLATVHWLAIPQESRDQSIAKAAEKIAEWLTNFMSNPATPLPVRVSALQAALVTSLQPSRNSYGKLVGAAMLIALIATAIFATGYLPFFKPAEQKSAAAANPASVLATPASVPSTVTRNTTIKMTGRPSGYAGVNPNAANPPMPPPVNGRMQNPNGMYPPPPPPPGAPPNGGRGFGAPNDGYPPPPPQGAPMFGPPNGPPGMPPNRGPRP